jgi:hypothetical protein
MMLYDSIWWYIMVYDGIWCYMMLYDVILWYMMLYDGIWWVMMAIYVYYFLYFLSLFYIRVFWTWTYYRNCALTSSGMRCCIGLRRITCFPPSPSTFTLAARIIPSLLGISSYTFPNFQNARLVLSFLSITISAILIVSFDGFADNFADSRRLSKYSFLHCLVNWSSIRCWCFALSLGFWLCWLLRNVGDSNETKFDVHKWDVTVWESIRYSFFVIIDEC